jgi:NitT/TauT family transport system ATP-binding protein
MLEVEGLCKTWGDPASGSSTEALKDFAVDVAEGEFVTVIGPSGCGKSTFLEIVAGLEPATSGTVVLNGTPLDGPHPDIGVVFQQDATFPWLTAEQNVEFGLEFSGVPKAERAARARDTLALVGLSDFAGHRPAELSGGMRQRVNIARVLASLPKVVLMDEPFGALDEQTRLLLSDEVLRLWRESGATFVLITHSLNEAALLSDRIVVMSSRPGCVKEIVDNPLPRPRSVEQFATEQFTAVTHHLWELLQQEAVQETSRVGV